MSNDCKGFSHTWSQIANVVLGIKFTSLQQSQFGVLQTASCTGGGAVWWVIMAFSLRGVVRCDERFVGWMHQTTSRVAKFACS